MVKRAAPNATGDVHEVGRIAGAELVKTRNPSKAAKNHPGIGIGATAIKVGDATAAVAAAVATEVDEAETAMAVAVVAAAVNRRSASPVWVAGFCRS